MLEDIYCIGSIQLHFVGEKCCIYNNFGLPTGLTFHSFVGATFISFVGPTIFVSQQIKTVGVGGTKCNCASFVVALLLFLHISAPKSVGGTFSLLLDQQFYSATYKTGFNKREESSSNSLKRQKLYM